MRELLKNMFNKTSVGKLALATQSVYKPFKVDDFLKSIFDEEWDNLELKARARKVSTNLGRYLPKDYKKAITILDKVAERYNDILYPIFSDFVEVFGQDETHWEISISALERYTKYSTSEFAIRPFITKDEKRMMATMYEWAKDKNEHTRRLASEGCRPQLPWAEALNNFKKDPSPILPILEELKADSSLYVRKSVANNLNDISKTHPNLVLKIAKKWYGKDEKTDWIIKRACRTLLKKGNRDILSIFGYHDNINIAVYDFALNKKTITLGETIQFSFTIKAEDKTNVRLEYGVDYIKSNGKSSRKIFQISETILKKDEQKTYKKNHTFADLSVRKHYHGAHSITLIVNGAERSSADFELTK